MQATDTQSPTHATNKVRIFSFGGGVQSHAVLVLQAQGKLREPYDYFVFSNVGHDSENPETLAYIEQYTIPFCAARGIEFVEVQKTTRGEPETLVEFIYRTERSVPIPARMSNGAPGNRTCTSDFKITVIDRWIRDNGYTHAIVGLGISTDEIQRMRSEKWYDQQSGKKFGFLKKREHPLIDLGLRRSDCKRLIEQAGLPVPPKSSCYFCPFMKRNEWKRLKRSGAMVTINGVHMPVFKAAVAIEHQINEKRGAIGRDRVYLHSATNGVMSRLEHAVGDQLELPFMAEFEEAEACGGYCHT